MLEEPEKAADVMDAITKLLESVSLDRKKSYEYNLIKEVAFSCTRNSNLNSELRPKLYETLMAFDVSQCDTLVADNSLKILSLHEPGLTHEERDKIKEAVQHGLVEKSRAVFQELLDLGISVDESNGNFSLGLNVEDKILVEHKNSLNETQQLYIVKLQELMATLEQIIKLKVQRFPDIASGKICSSELELSVCHLKAAVVNTKARINVFTESSTSMNAYQEVMKDIHKQQVECKDEIIKLRELKERYKQVSCKEYDEILKSYIQYKSKIVQKRLMYNQLHGKELPHK